MIIQEDKIRNFEDEYYAARPSEVLDAIEARDEGWKIAKAGDIDSGIRLVNISWQALTYPDHTGLSDRFGREYFATVARMAQLNAIKGDFSSAAGNACHALKRYPKNFEIGLDEDPDSDPIFEYRPDQYGIIFGGSLALILATSDWRDDRSAGRDLAWRARFDSRWSEDPENVIFTDREMAPEDRVDTQKKFEKMAITANLAYLLPPVPAIRERFAGKILRKAAGIS